MTTFSKQAELDFMHNFRHDTEGDRWAKHEIESLRAENMELKNNITICSVRIKELSQQVTLLREALRWSASQQGKERGRRRASVEQHFVGGGGGGGEWVQRCARMRGGTAALLPACVGCLEAVFCVLFTRV